MDARGICALIPALDEEISVGLVVSDLRRAGLAEIVVVDNGSRDATARVAREAGATVVPEGRRGYGSACLAGLASLRQDPPEIVVFVDADRSDDLTDLEALLRPLCEGRADLVIGSRALGRADPGAMTLPQRFGNWLATRLIRLGTGHRFTDLGPFRAIRWAALERLEMTDRGYGWTVEMQVKAARRGVVWTEVPVRYRRRVGRSKISGTVRGVVGAGSKILYTVAREVLRPGARG
jgi:glycosyltransferase involved in cell wall biosynthesis